MKTATAAVVDERMSAIAPSSDSLRTGSILTATGLRDLVKGINEVEQENIGQASSARISTLIDGFKNFSFDEGRKVFKQAKALTNPEGLPKSLEDSDMAGAYSPDPSTYARLSEANAVFTATKLAGYSVMAGLGWQRVVNAARDSLDLEGFMVSGSRFVPMSKLSEWQHVLDSQDALAIKELRETFREDRSQQRFNGKVAKAAWESATPEEQSMFAEGKIAPSLAEKQSEIRQAMEGEQQVSAAVKALEKIDSVDGRGGFDLFKLISEAPEGVISNEAREAAQLIMEAINTLREEYGKSKRLQVVK